LYCPSRLPPSSHFGWADCLGWMGNSAARDSRRSSTRSEPASRRCGGACWLVLRDPCGWACVLVCYVLAIGISSLVNFYILLPCITGVLTCLHAIGYNGVVLALLACHIRCMCTDPGSARQHLEEELLTMMRHEHQHRSTSECAEVSARRWWCTRCDTFRPKHTHHCSTCRCCVLDMDHHCPWVNNCIGWRNHKYFLLFLLYAWIACAWSAMVFLCSLGQPAPDATLRMGAPEGDTTALIFPEGSGAGEEAWRPLAALPFRVSGGLRQRSWFPSHAGLLQRSFVAQLGCFFACVVCFLMMIFVSVMCCDQWEYMTQGFAGAVEKKQALLATSEDSEVKETEAWYGKRLLRIMGTGQYAGLRWLLPLAPGPREMMMVSEDALIVRARQRYVEAAAKAETTAPLSVAAAVAEASGPGDPLAAKAPAEAFEAGDRDKSPSPTLMTASLPSSKLRQHIRGDLTPPRRRRRVGSGSPLQAWRRAALAAAGMEESSAEQATVAAAAVALAAAPRDAHRKEGGSPSRFGAIARSLAWSQDELTPSSASSNSSWPLSDD